MKPKAAVAISGGIDSLVTALLLKKKYKKNIVGLHFFNGYESGAFHPPELPDSSDSNNDSPCSLSELPATHPIHHIKKQLDIPIKLVDCRQYFQKTIVDYFVESYCRGLTPNPCMICNPLIKFGVIFNLAQKLGASCLATGHYARIYKKNGLYLIQKGVDASKDQSYFLGFLSKAVLPFVHFPLGTMTKQQVVKMAEREKLTPVLKKESQDVCFIRNNDYPKFILSQGKDIGAKGIITDINGREIGTHNGLHNFTIGQRRGINCPAGKPYYVLKIDIKQNRLVVGEKKNLYKTGLRMSQMNWFIPTPESPLNVSVKIRYRHHAAEAKLIPENNSSAMIRFKKPQPAITPGQGAVCYADDCVIAGGWIDE